jgi:hypothetical protein
MIKECKEHELKTQTKKKFPITLDRQVKVIVKQERATSRLYPIFQGMVNSFYPRGGK